MTKINSGIPFQRWIVMERDTDDADVIFPLLILDHVFIFYLQLMLCLWTSACGDCNTLDFLFMKFGSSWQCSFFVGSAVMAITAHDNYLFLHQGIFLTAEVKAFIKSTSNIIVLHWQYKVEKRNVYLPKNIGNYLILDNPAVLLFNGNFCLGAPRGQCTV